MPLPLEDDPRPPYLQAAEVLRSAIATGELAPGCRLPSARELQTDFGISSSTVQNALRVLKREGLVYSVLGRGSYVRQVPDTASDAVISQPRVTASAGSPDPRPSPAAVADDPRPPYVQAADALRDEIQVGFFAPGSRIPATRELQERFGIANSTAQNALRVLKAEGLIYAVKGRGVFVRSTKKEHTDGSSVGTSSIAQPGPSPQDCETVEPAAHGPTDEQIASALEAAKQRLARARAECEVAATSYRDIARQAEQRGLRSLCPPSGGDASCETPVPRPSPDDDRVPGLRNG